MTFLLRIRRRPGNNAVLLALATLLPCLESARAGEKAAPWLANDPIVTVAKELYLPQETPGHGIWAKQFNVGSGLERIEIRSEEVSSDIWTNIRSRLSNENGRTWSDWQTLPNNLVNYNGVQVWEGDDMTMPVYDDETGVLIQPFHRIVRGDAEHFNCFAYYRLSRDHGRTWFEPRQLKYEAGPDFSPDNPLDPEYLKKNRGYPGQKFLKCADGSLLIGLSHANDANDPENEQRRERLGAVALVGAWNPRLGDYEWTASRPVDILPEQSSRGLQETDVGQLKDGRLLFVWRGSNTSQTPGRKWFSISSDGGKTLSPVAEWKYSDGSPFYSPSSIHRLFRHRGTGNLYWIGNICADPPQGNSPRYPLIIAQVDEETGGLLRDTVSVIADREPDQSPLVQFSNFSLLENPEDSTVELLISHLQADGNAGKLNADVYKYTLTFTAGDRP